MDTNDETPAPGETMADAIVDMVERKIAESEERMRAEIEQCKRDVFATIESALT